MLETQTPLRLAWLTDHYPDPTSLRDIEALRRLGLQIHVVSLHEVKAELSEAERQEAVRVFYLERTAAAQGRPPHQRAWRRPTAYLKTVALAARLGGTDLNLLKASLRHFHQALVLVEWMQSRDLNHVHIQSGLDTAAVGVLARSIGSIRLSLAIDGPKEFHDETRYRLRDKLAAASFVCARNQHVRAELCRLLPAHRWDDVVVVLSGVDLENLIPVAPPVNGGPVRLLAAAPLEDAQGQSILLEALARRQDTSPAIHLTLAGEGSSRSALEAQVQRLNLVGNVTLVGPLDRDALHRQYQQCDAFVHTSLVADSPPELLEAMAMQLPCIATALPGVLINHEKDGLLAAPADLESLSSAMDRLVGDAQRRRRLGQAARATIEESHDAVQTTERLAELLQARLRQDA